MKRLFLLSLILIAMFSMVSCRNNTDNTPKTSSANDIESSYETTAEDDTFSISICGLELKYPTKWKSRVTVTTSDNRACFTCGETKLFDLTFNTDEGYVLGTVEGDEYTVIRIVDYLFESEDQDLYAMQEDVNVILEHLMSDYTFAVGEALEKEDNTTFDIQTSVVTMKYPNKWKDKVQVKVSETEVKFSNNGTSLFDLVFTDCDGYLLGTYKDTPIYIVDYHVESDEQAAMQEDVNVILQNLMEDSNFTINN